MILEEFETSAQLAYSTEDAHVTKDFKGFDFLSEEKCSAVILKMSRRKLHFCDKTSCLAGGSYSLKRIEEYLPITIVNNQMNSLNSSKRR